MMGEEGWREGGGGWREGWRGRQYRSRQANAGGDPTLPSVHLPGVDREVRLPVGNSFGIWRWRGGNAKSLHWKQFGPYNPSVSPVSLAAIFTHIRTIFF